MRPLLVGMNNPVSVDPRHALYPVPRGCTGHRLWLVLNELDGTSVSRYLRLFERVNLVQGRWNAVTARARAQELRPTMSGRSSVLLGREVWGAFHLPRVEACASVDLHDAVVYFVPHPSGRNLWYNDGDNRRRVGELLASLARP